MGKRGLGRGLSALIPEAPEIESDAPIRELPVGEIVPNPYQPRNWFDPGKLEELADSIREHGVLQPLLVRKAGAGNYQIVAGERRFRAAQKAGLEKVPALIKECSEQELLEMAIVENVQREDISIMEAARAYKRLNVEFNMTQEQVAQRVGKSRSAITNLLRLLELPPAVQESLESGEITEGHGRAILIAKTDEGMQHVWETLVKKKLNVRDTEKLAAEVKESANRPLVPSGLRQNIFQPANGGNGGNGRPNGSDPHEGAFVTALQEALKTKVTLKRVSGLEGRIEIAFYSPEDLERLVELLLLGKGLA